MARQLKVFSTPAGFFNAVVAAPSQKAALEAWGLRENVFANGAATVVTDPELIARALETPGEIVRVPVGSDAAILAGVKRPPKAPPEQQTAAKAKVAPATPSPRSVQAPPPPPPPPDRIGLTAAEEALAAAEARKEEVLDQLDEELRTLEAERRRSEAALEGKVQEARSAHEAAQKRYRASGGVD